MPNGLTLDPRQVDKLLADEEAGVLPPTVAEALTRLRARGDLPPAKPKLPDAGAPLSAIPPPPDADGDWRQLSALTATRSTPSEFMGKVKELGKTVGRPSVAVPATTGIIGNVLGARAGHPHIGGAIGQGVGEAAVMAGEALRDRELPSVEEFMGRTGLAVASEAIPLGMRAISAPFRWAANRPVVTEVGKKIKDLMGDMVMPHQVARSGALDTLRNIADAGIGSGKAVDAIEAGQEQIINRQAATISEQIAGKTPSQPLPAARDMQQEVFKRGRAARRVEQQRYNQILGRTSDPDAFGNMRYRQMDPVTGEIRETGPSIRALHQRRSDLLRRGRQLLNSPQEADRNAAREILQQANEALEQMKRISRNRGSITPWQDYRRQSTLYRKTAEQYGGKFINQIMKTKPDDLVDLFTDPSKFRSYSSKLNAPVRSAPELISHLERALSPNREVYNNFRANVWKSMVRQASSPAGARVPGGMVINGKNLTDLIDRMGPSFEKLFKTNAAPIRDLAEVITELQRPVSQTKGRVFFALRSPSAAIALTSAATAAASQATGFGGEATVALSLTSAGVNSAILIAPKLIEKIITTPALARHLTRTLKSSNLSRAIDAFNITFGHYLAAEARQLGKGAEGEKVEGESIAQPDDTSIPAPPQEGQPPFDLPPTRGDIELPPSPEVRSTFPPTSMTMRGVGERLAGDVGSALAGAVGVGEDNSANRFGAMVAAGIPLLPTPYAIKLFGSLLKSDKDVGKIFDHFTFQSSPPKGSYIIVDTVKNKPLYMVRNVDDANTAMATNTDYIAIDANHYLRASGDPDYLRASDNPALPTEFPSYGYEDLAELSPSSYKSSVARLAPNRLFALDPETRRVVTLFSTEDEARAFQLAYPQYSVGEYVGDKDQWVDALSWDYGTPRKGIDAGQTMDHGWFDPLTQKEIPIPPVPVPVRERAEAAGYKLPVWHGTAAVKNFDEFKPIAATELADLGIHTAEHPATAIRAAGRVGQRPRVMPLMARTERPLEVPDIGRFKSPIDWAVGLGKSGINVQGLKMDDRRQTLTELYKVAKNLGEKYNSMTGRAGDRQSLEREWAQALGNILNKHGFDSLKYKNIIEGSGDYSYMFLNPAQLRSWFARFDPSKIKSKNLMDSLLLGAVLSDAARRMAEGETEDSIPPPPLSR